MATNNTDACPYPGLRPFLPEEADLFFGRDEQVDAILERLGRVRFLVVGGSSGCGKSSLILAGMIPALGAGLLAKVGSGWSIVTMRPGDRPFDRLAKALVSSRAVGGAVDLDSVPVIEACLRSGPLGLVELIRDRCETQEENVLLVVDQFEEVFRFRMGNDGGEADAFVALLLASTRQSNVPIHVVLTMRSEFLGDCTVFGGLPEAINEGYFLIPRLDRGQRQEAIEGPARVHGGRVDSHLVNRLLNDMGEAPDQLPLMQHAMMQLWRRAAGRGSPVLLTTDEYEEIGGMGWALSNHANQAFAGLDAAQQVIAETMFRCLTERSPDGREVRRPARLEEVALVAGVPFESVARVVEVFREPHLSFLTPPFPVELGPGTIIDISHESLIRQWHRMRSWIDAEADASVKYSRIEQTARFWRDGRGGLLVAPEITDAIRWRDKQKPNDAWADRYGGDLGLAMRFLDESLAQQKIRQNRQAIMGCSAAFVWLLFLLAGIAYIFKMVSPFLARLFGRGG
jgi:hypothetical protein